MSEDLASCVAISLISCLCSASQHNIYRCRDLLCHRYGDVCSLLVLSLIVNLFAAAFTFETHFDLQVIVLHHVTRLPFIRGTVRVFVKIAVMRGQIYIHIRKAIPSVSTVQSNKRDCSVHSSRQRYHDFNPQLTII